MVKQFAEKVEVMNLCTWACVPRSVFYYRKKDGKPGVPPSTHTFKQDGSRVENSQVIEDIKKILQEEYVTYGYDMVTEELRGKEYIINPKKTYRLMGENNLLLGKRIHTTGKRDFVKFRKMKARYPMEYLCMDIKYVWVEGERRNYYLLTVLDVYSRKAIAHIFLPSIRKHHVIALFMRLASQYDVRGVIVRNDNGSQFIANSVRKYLKELQMRQEFTHISTPQENGYIEGFFSNLRRDVLSKMIFESYYEAKIKIDGYMNFYNCKRRHRSIGKITPQEKWNQYMEKKQTIGNIIFVLSGKAETGSAEEQPARNNLTRGKVMEGTANTVPSYPDTFPLPNASENLNEKPSNNNQTYKTVFEILSN